MPRRGPAAHPDRATVDRLIRDKLAGATGRQSPGPQRFAVRQCRHLGLMITGALVSTHPGDLAAGTALTRLLARGGNR